MGHGHPPSDNLSSLAGGVSEQMDLSNEDDSESDTGDEDLFAGINMDALKQRGKGSHICPKGTRCDKGGVDKDGNVIVFDRNSSFAYVPNPPGSMRCASHVADPMNHPTSLLMRVQTTL